MTKPAPDGGYDFEGELRRIMWALSGPNRSGEPVGAERKRIMRQIRRIGTNGTRPVDAKAQTDAAHQRGLRFVEMYFANVERARRDPKYLKLFPRKPRSDQTVMEFYKDREARMAKPWKGAAGRKAKCKRSDVKRRLALELHRQGLTRHEIAARIDRSERTVRTYLNRQF